METERVLKVARQSGYATIEYLGKYKEYDLYKPLYKDPHMAPVSLFISLLRTINRNS